MDANQRAKILDKIKKCLALGSSPNENEAAVAMGQAAKMMERHGITERELGTVGYSKATIQTTTQTVAGKTLPDNLTCITRLVRHAFGVRAVFTSSLRVSDYSYDVNYYGPEHRVMLAEYAHVIIQRAIDSQYKKYVLAHPHLKGKPGVRSGFAVGWCAAARSKILAFAMSDEEVAATDLLAGNVSNAATNKTALDPRARYAGEKVGKDFSIHTPMATKEVTKIGN